MRNNGKDKIHNDEFFLLFQVQLFFQMLSGLDAK